MKDRTEYGIMYAHSDTPNTYHFSQGATDADDAQEKADLQNERMRVAKLPYHYVPCVRTVSPWCEMRKAGA